ncbi:hypothetical protein PR048_009493, partial [Dryococelus australis]
MMIQKKGGVGEEVILTGREKSFEWKLFFVIIDRLRKEAYCVVASTFPVFSNLSSSSPSEISERAAKLQVLYENDCSIVPQRCSKVTDTPLSMSKFLKQENLQQMFPNVGIALRMYLCTAVSNCSAERSFSALKRVKSYLRSTMKEQKLNSLAILHIEADILNCEGFEYEDLIDEFATMKVRHRCSLIMT